MPETNPTIAPLYGGYANTTRHTETDPPDVAAAPPGSPHYPGPQREATHAPHRQTSAAVRLAVL